MPFFRKSTASGPSKRIFVSYRYREPESADRAADYAPDDGTNMALVTAVVDALSAHGHQVVWSEAVSACVRRRPEITLPYVPVLQEISASCVALTSIFMPIVTRGYLSRVAGDNWGAVFEEFQIAAYLTSRNKAVCVPIIINADNDALNEDPAIAAFGGGLCDWRDGGFHSAGERARHVAAAIGDLATPDPAAKDKSVASCVDLFFSTTHRVYKHRGCISADSWATDTQSALRFVGSLIGDKSVHGARISGHPDKSRDAMFVMDDIISLLYAHIEDLKSNPDCILNLAETISQANQKLETWRFEDGEEWAWAESVRLQTFLHCSEAVLMTWKTPPYDHHRVSDPYQVYVRIYRRLDQAASFYAHLANAKPKMKDEASVSYLDGLLNAVQFALVAMHASALQSAAGLDSSLHWASTALEDQLVGKGYSFRHNFSAIPIYVAYRDGASGADVGLRDIIFAALGAIYYHGTYIAPQFAMQPYTAGAARMRAGL